MAVLKNKVVTISHWTANIKDYITSSPFCEEEKLLSDLNINRRTLYSILAGLVEDNSVCMDKKQFKIIKNGKNLSIDEVIEYLQKNNSRRTKLQQTERLLYLYNLLHSNIPNGGIEMNKIIESYKELMLNSCEEIPADSALRRMIYRDLNALENMNISLVRPRENRRGKYGLREIYLPKLPAESAALVYTSMLPYRNTLLEPVVAAAQEELEKAIRRAKPVPDYIEKIRQRIYVIGDTLVSPQKFGDTLGKLIKAVTHNFRIKIIYSYRDGSEEGRVLDPLGMVCKRSVWYLVARKVVDNKPEYRVYRVDQIKHVYLRESEVYEYPENFSLHNYISSSWGVFCNDPIRTVRVKFMPSVAFRLKNVKYHPTQKIVQECDDGSIIVEYEVCGLVEMKSWMMQWGDEAEVIEPEELRKSIVETAAKILNKYSSKSL
ncbi:WYL domain-containing protein [Thermosyntropha sp.]|uniref:helix-turn-helix transcriptional regulator n=1 Tax=Thermosyntropha sp. TaxID=2740820 RepID=UPI0025DF2990|nr:WYL domain-containing protein [Thermosyntropha sp.]MBO8158498.1 WYL domain-containing protein [Thermosyntropha sp.]